MVLNLIGTLLGLGLGLGGFGTKGLGTGLDNYESFDKSELSTILGRVVCDPVFQPIGVHNLCSNPMKN